MGHIRPIFATPLYVEQFFDFEHLEELNVYLDHTEYKTEGKLSTDNYQSVNSDILSDEKLHRVRDFIQNCLLEYVIRIQSSNQKLSITQSWVNKTETGKFHRLHHHPNSIVSGIFYLKAEQDAPPVKFQRPDTLPFQFAKDFHNEFNSDTYFYDATPGTLLLFPSNIPHVVEQNNSEKDRVSISFNTFAYGILGSEFGLTLLSTSQTGTGA